MKEMGWTQKLNNEPVTNIKTRFWKLGPSLLLYTYFYCTIFPIFQSAVNKDVAGDWKADDSDDEEPKYIWRNVTKNGDIKKCILVDGKMDSGST